MDRDDLADGGCSHIARTISLLKERTEGRLLVEALVPDFQGDMACVKVGRGGSNAPTFQVDMACKGDANLHV